MTSTDSGIITADPFSERARHGEDTLLKCAVKLSTGGTVTAVYYPGPGEDTWPCKGDEVTLNRNGGFWEIIGARQPGAPDQKPGEREFYGRNAAGEIKSRILLDEEGSIITKNDKDILTEAQGKEDVRITGKSYHQSADTDLRSTAPVGLNDGLRKMSLNPYWMAEKAALTSALPQLAILDAMSGSLGFIIGLGNAMIAADNAADAAAAPIVK
jgi:hypothetical protein